MNNIKTAIIAICSLCVISCSDSSSELTTKAQMKVRASIENATQVTRAAIDGTSFADGSVIGVFVEDASGAAYSADASNVASTLTGGEWTFANPVSLTETEGNVYAYYPYASSVNSTVIPVETASQTDYLYGAADSKVSKAQNVANLNFRHALTRITFNIKKKEASVYDMTLKNVTFGNATGSTKIANEGTLDIKTGTITPTENASATVVVNKEEAITENAISVDILLLPFSISSGDVKVTFAINDAVYQASLGNQEFAAGNRYIYPVTTSVSSGNEDDDDDDDNPVILEIGTVTITDWTSVNMEELGELENITETEAVKAVDLGLPSGNKWANRNMGAYTATGYGSYYAWGESSSKSIYSEDNYFYKDKNLGSNISGTIYDVAHKVWGDSWVIPTKEDWQELIDYCSWVWTTEGGVNGMKATGNGNSVFFPASGYTSNAVIYQGEWGLYNTANSSSGVMRFQVKFTSDYSKPAVEEVYGFWQGISIRAVSK